MTPAKNKIKSLEQLRAISRRARLDGKKVVFTNGCFDIFHAGHVKVLEWAKLRGDILIVAINSDASVRLNKGKSRPIIPARDRALVIAGQASVDYVYIFSAKTVVPGLKKIRPAIWVKGKDVKSHPDYLVTKKMIEDLGGSICFAPIFSGRSTTKIVEKIKNA
jgi:rfaE bifunctional protein nucleotidyltransferase chain/domain